MRDGTPADPAAPRLRETREEGQGRSHSSGADGRAECHGTCISFPPSLIKRGGKRKNREEEDSPATKKRGRTSQRQPHRRWHQEWGGRCGSWWRGSSPCPLGDDSPQRAGGRTGDGAPLRGEAGWARCTRGMPKTRARVLWPQHPPPQVMRAALRSGGGSVGRGGCPFWPGTPKIRGVSSTPFSGHRKPDAGELPTPHV